MRANAYLVMALAVVLVAGSATKAVAQTSDDLFNDQKLQRIDIFVHSKDWALLKATFDENTHYPADVRWGGQAARNASIRSRGSGSRSATKPGLLIDFGHYVSGQTFLGLQKLVLKNLTQDPSTVREFLAMKLLRRMGIAAPREAYAVLYVNNAYSGLYGIVENIDSVATQRILGEGTGYLYEYNWLSYYYFTYPGTDLQAYAGMYKPVTHESESPSALYGTFEAWTRTVNDVADQDFIGAVQAYLDLVPFIRLTAAQAYLSELDDFLGSWAMNNFFIYRFSGKSVHQLIAWDEDHALWFVDYPVTVGHNENVLMRRIMASPGWSSAYLATVLEAADVANQVNEAVPGQGWLEAEASRVIAMVRDAVYADPYKPYSNDEFELDAARALSFTQQRGPFVRCEVARLTGGRPPNQPCSVPAGIRSIR